MTTALVQVLASLVWGIVVPALIFVIAFVVTMLLYRHFSKQI